MNPRIDVNCDLGESYGHFRIGHDSEIMPYITSANIACGFHGGDPATMLHTVRLAKKSKVAVGAHPGFPDLMGFGRRDMGLSKEELRSTVVYQLGALEALAETENMNLQHIKPHGALYNIAAKKDEYAEALIEAVLNTNSDLIMFAMPDSRLAELGTEAGLKVAFEVFADRAYSSDGSLVPRNREGAIISDTGIVASRAVRMVKERKVTAIDGQTVSFNRIHTICVHGDTSNSVELAKSIRKAFQTANIQVLCVNSFF
jgi:UPF0271 protein